MDGNVLFRFALAGCCKIDPSGAKRKGKSGLARNSMMKPKAIQSPRIPRAASKGKILQEEHAGNPN